MKTHNSGSGLSRKLPAILVIIIGIALMIMKIIADSEPGAIPLLLIVSGAGWLAFLQFRRQGS